MVYCVALGIQQVLDALYYELMLVRLYRFVSKAHTQKQHHNQLPINSCFFLSLPSVQTGFNYQKLICFEHFQTSSYSLCWSLNLNLIT